MNIVDLQNVIGLARKAISLIGDKLPSEQGEAAYKSIGEVENLARNLIQQQQQQQQAAQTGNQEPVVEEVTAETPKKSRRSKKKKESDDDKPVKVNVVEINDDE